MTEDWGAILVVDDDAEMRELVHDVLKDRGHQVSTAGGGEEALKLLAEQDCSVVVTDLRMKGMQGTELLAEIQRLYPEIGVILMTAFGSVDNAVEAMKRGASDYLTKPVKNEELVRVVERVIREASLRREVNRLRREVHKEYSFHQIIGKSKPMQEIFDLIRRVADSPTNLLITGESGTGKELVAKAIHYNSDRKDAPFIPVNCAAIPEQLLESELFGHMRGAFTDAKVDKRGLFEEAQKGTLFLDEISELPLDVAGQDLARDPGERDSPCGGQQTDRRRCAHHCGDEPPSDGRGQGETLSGGLVLPAQRDRTASAPLARASRGYPVARRCIHEEVCSVSRKTDTGGERIRAGDAGGLHLARQCAGIGECDRAGRHAQPKRKDRS